MDGIRGIDVVIALSLRHTDVERRERPTLWLASALQVSTQTVHGSLKRLRSVRLLAPRSHDVVVGPFMSVADAAPYVFPVSPGPISGGVPTATSTAPLNAIFAGGDVELDFVWVHGSGTIRGASIEPLHRSVPDLAVSDNDLHADLALFDAMRLTDPRVRREARALLAARLEHD